MTETILDAPAKVIDYVDQVRRLADANKDALGFLSAIAYEEAATRGCLWVAVSGSARRLRGYLFFGVRFPRLRVYQVYVCPEFRSSGTARALIERLKRYGEDRDYLSISARVASELPANRFWQALGFNVIGRCPGGKKGRTINRYALALNVPSLFGRDQPSEDARQQLHVRPVLETRSYVIDLNVFFDAVRDRDEGEAIRILSMSLDSDMRLAVTVEFTRELERHSRRSGDPVLKLARALPTLTEPRQEDLNPLVEDLRRDLFSIDSPKTGRRAANDASDLSHLASCIHHRVYGFITRDGLILRRAEELYEKYNLRVISPADLCEPLGEARDRQQRMTAIVGRQEIEIASFDESYRVDVERFLRDIGAPAGDMSACLAPGTTSFPTLVSVIRTGQRIVGIGSWVARPGAGRESVARLYVDEDSQCVDRVVDHLLEQSINRGKHGQLSRLELKIGPGQVRIRDVAIRRGFCPPDFRSGPTSETLSKVSMKGVVTDGNWRSFRNSFREATGLELPSKLPRYEELANTGVVLNAENTVSPSTVPLFEFETVISPGALICPGRNAVMVPVQERYVRQLLPLADDQPSFLAQREVVLRLERTYFLAAGRHRLFQRGTLVVFYASRERREAVAIARVTFSGTLTKIQAVLNLRRQGVLTEEEIDQKSNERDEIAAFTFDNLIIFRNAIPYRELKQLGCIEGANLVTAQKLPYDKLCRLAERAFALEMP